MYIMTPLQISKSKHIMLKDNKKAVPRVRSKHKVSAFTFYIPIWNFIYSLVQLPACSIVLVWNIVFNASFKTSFTLCGCEIQTFLMGLKLRACITVIMREGCYFLHLHPNCVNDRCGSTKK